MLPAANLGIPILSHVKSIFIFYHANVLENEWFGYIYYISYYYQIYNEMKSIKSLDFLDLVFTYSNSTHIHYVVFHPRKCSCIKNWLDIQ